MEEFCCRRAPASRGHWRPSRHRRQQQSTSSAVTKTQLQHVVTYSPDGDELGRAEAKQHFIHLVQIQMEQHKQEGSTKHMYEIGVAGSSEIWEGASSPQAPVAFLDPAPRPAGITVISDALPVAFARRVAKALSNATETEWATLSSDAKTQEAVELSHRRQLVQNEATGDAADSRLQEMRYSRLLDSGGAFDRQEVAQEVSKALRLQPHERLLLNFARYREGDFLDSHTDRPSGNAAYDRHRAWVWHLSEGWDESMGGAFVDEETETKYYPSFNRIVHFAVPRSHRVEPVTRRGAARYTAYGWVITAEVLPLRSVSLDVARLRNESGGVAVVGWFGETPWKQPARRHAIDLASTCLATIGIDRVRGEYARFAIATNAEVARALGLCRYGAAAGDYAVGVIRWGLSRVDVLAFAPTGGPALPGGVDALGTFLDEHRGHEHGVESLDCDDHASMVAMYATPDVKVYVFLRDEDLPQYEATLVRLQRALRPAMRLFTCDPRRTRSIMAEAAVDPSRLPSVYIHDVHGLHDPRRRRRPVVRGDARSWLFAGGTQRTWRMNAGATPGRGAAEKTTPDAVAAFVERVAGELMT